MGKVILPRRGVDLDEDQFEKLLAKTLLPIAQKVVDWLIERDGVNEVELSWHCSWPNRWVYHPCLKGVIQIKWKTVEQRSKRMVDHQVVFILLAIGLRVRVIGGREIGVGFEDHERLVPVLFGKSWPARVTETNLRRGSWEDEVKLMVNALFALKATRMEGVIW